MAQLFNKNGLLVRDNLKAIQDELIRGTGFVMGKKVSAFMERESLHEKKIVIWPEVAVTSYFNEEQELAQYLRQKIPPNIS